MIKSSKFVAIAIGLAGCLLLVAASQAFAADSGSSSSSSSSPSSSSKSSSSSTATQPRQSSAASLIGAIGSLVPGLISNVAPLVVLLGLGALMMPAIGMGAMGLLREARRSGNDQANAGLPNFQLPAAFAQYARPLQGTPQDIYYFTQRSFPSLMSNLNSAGIMAGLQDLADRVARAIDNADRRYN